MKTTILRNWLKDNHSSIQVTEMYVPLHAKPHIIIRLDSKNWNEVSDTEDDGLNIAIKEIKRRINQEIPALITPKKKGRPKKLFP